VALAEAVAQSSNSINQGKLANFNQFPNGYLDVAQQLAEDPCLVVRRVVRISLFILSLAKIVDFLHRHFEHTVESYQQSFLSATVSSKGVREAGFAVIDR
jgi:hypothetical protein